jgi:cytochrome P450
MPDHRVPVDGGIPCVTVADTKDEAGVGLTDEEISDEVLTLLMAGHETTATTLAWALHHLAANPAAQQRLFGELSGSFPEGVVDPDRARKLPADTGEQYYP